MKWITGSKVWNFPRPAIVMGIVNVTPDSFSDGGQFLRVEQAVEHALKLESEGAEILDIGGESTRPGAHPVSAAEEIDRVIPVLEALAGQVRAVLSIDTMKPGVAEAALKAGAEIVNDVAAAIQDEKMWRLVAASGAGYVCMHMKGNPVNMQLSPSYANVLAEMEDFFRERLARMASAGVREENVALDVGLGFGKTDEHNLKLLANMQTFTNLGRPMVLGASRKSFLGRLLGIPLAQRLAASLACAQWGAGHGAAVIRVHDVAETVQTVRLLEIIQNSKTN